MWRTLFKVLSYGAATIFAFMSFVIMVDLVALSRADRRVFEDLKLRVAAVERFQERSGRLPEEKELTQLWDELPNSGRSYNFYLSRGDIPRPRGKIIWPTSGGWAVWVWLGELSEYYTSWDRHFSQSQPMSWFAIEGWLLFSPLIAVFFLFMPHLARKKKKPNQTSEPTAPSGRGSP
jgi:hypothetical protein